MGARADVIVVGGGVVGVSVAYFASLAGAEVVLLERDEIASGSSRANAGLVVTSYCTPMPSPDALAQAAEFFLDREGPFSLRPRLEMDFLRFVWRFLRSSNPRQFNRAVEIFVRLNVEGARVHRELAGLARGAYEYSRKGLLYLFTTEKTFRACRRQAQDLVRFGVQTSVLEAGQVREMEPAAGPGVIGGIHYRDDSSLKPAAFVHWLADQARSRGCRILTGCEVYGFEASGRRVTCVLTTRGRFRAEQVVLAAGAWQPLLGRALGRRIPVEGAKGYSLALPRPRVCPGRPLLLEEKHIAVSPYSDFVRVTGILDFQGLDLAISRRRLRMIQPQASTYLPSLAGVRPREVWRGLRPCSPDGLPLAGLLSPWSNVFAVGGHDTKGMSLGPVSGLLVSRLLAGQPPGDLERALSPARFR